MDEPTYEIIDETSQSDPFAYVFVIRNLDLESPIFFRRVTSDDFWPLKEPVIDWLTERFGPGAVSRPSELGHEMESYCSERDAVSFAWSMDCVGTVAFQNENHAFEFRMRWCG